MAGMNPQLVGEELGGGGGSFGCGAGSVGVEGASRSGGTESKVVGVILEGLGLDLWVVAVISWVVGLSP